MQACRTCLKLIDATQCKYFDIEGADVQLTASSVRYKILSIVPEMALNIVNPAIICEPCNLTLENLFQFKSTCLKTESMIMHYLNTTLDMNTHALNLRSVAILNKTGYVKEPVLEPAIDLEKSIEEVIVKEEMVYNSEISEDNSQDGFVDDENITIVKHEVTNYDSEIIEIHPPDNKVLSLINKDEHFICNELEIEVSAKENKEVDLKTNIDIKLLQVENEETKLDEFKEDVKPIQGLNLQPNISDSTFAKEGEVTNVTALNECISKGGPSIESLKSKSILENELKCEVCLKYFVSKFRLKAHMLCHTDERPYKCTICPKAFNDKSTLNKHLKIHTGIREFQCDICQRQFYCKGNLNKHALTHSGERPFKCEICDKEFSRNEHLKQHTFIHTGEKLFECEICSKKFARRDSLIVHMMVHTGERNYVCEYCNKRCIDSSTLKKHLRSHTGDKPYECEVCKHRFTQKTHLTIHKRKHTGERPYNCEICQKSFYSNNYLKIHIRTHTKEQPYNCEVCQRKFSTLSNLSMHRKIHTGIKDFQCASCPKSFIHKHDLKKHIMVHTQEKPFSCHICKKSFSKKSRAKSHILSLHKQVDINTVVIERYKTTVIGQETNDCDKSMDLNGEEVNKSQID